MRSSLIGTAAALLAAALGVAQGGGLAIPFYVFDNGVGRGQWTPREQAAALKELGYDGISYNYTNNKDLEERLAAFKAQGIRIFGLYFQTYIDRSPQYDPDLKEAARLLRGSGTVLWMTIAQPREKGDHEAAAVRIAQEIADLAQSNGLHAALYPHAGFYVATARDSTRVVRKAQRPNLGATINLCHEFLSNQGDQVEKTVRETAPHATMISINGVDVASKRYILRLDEGDYDVGGFLEVAMAAGYRGPVGLQCFGVAGDQKDNLKANIAAWRRLAARLK